MAGGIGSRFWPMSTTEKPKQFLDILGVGRTLIQQTYDRFEHICPKENIYVVTNELYKDLVIEQLGIDENQVIAEPLRRNTAPCIAYASFKIAALNPDANLIVAPSDHLILNQPEYERIMSLALEQAMAEDCLITLGIKPSRPDTKPKHERHERGNNRNFSPGDIGDLAAFMFFMRTVERTGNPFKDICAGE